MLDSNLSATKRVLSEQDPRNRNFSVALPGGEPNHCGFRKCIWSPRYVGQSGRYINDKINFYLVVLYELNRTLHHSSADTISGHYPYGLRACSSGMFILLSRKEWTETSEPKRVNSDYI